MTNTVVWQLENPVNITATDLIQITWEPTTFNISNLGNFSLNLWLIHNDDQSDAIQNSYANLLLAQNQNVHNNSVYWVPATTSIDIDVPQPGNHQLAWEENSKNPEALPYISKNDMGGTSSEFTILPPAGWSFSSTSVIPTSTTPASLNTLIASTTTDSTSKASSSSPTNTSSSDTSSKTSHSTILGLSIGLGVLFLLCIICISILLRRRVTSMSRKTEPYGIGYVSPEAREMKQQRRDTVQLPIPSELESRVLGSSELESYPMNMNRPARGSSRL